MHMVKSCIRCVEDAEWCDYVVGDLSSFPLEIGDISIHSRPEVMRCYHL